MDKFTVETYWHDELAEDVKEMSGQPYYWHNPYNVLVVRHNGKIIRVQDDRMEPEDATLTRDMSWIVDALNEAYELGRSDQPKAKLTGLQLVAICQKLNCVEVKKYIEVTTGQATKDIEGLRYYDLIDKYKGFCENPLLHIPHLDHVRSQRLADYLMGEDGKENA